MRSSLKQLLGATFGLAVLLVIVEHSGGFSKVLGASAGAYSTGFNALIGHASIRGRAKARG